MNLDFATLFASIMLYVSGFLIPAQTPQPCEPQPDHWFIEIYSISSMLLPENVTIELSPRVSAIGFLLIQNNSEIPLYILPQNARNSILITAEPEFAEEGLAEENTPQETLVIHRVHEFSAFVVTNNAPLRLDIENFSSLVPYIEARNIADYQRPSLIYLPVTQRGDFLLVYNDQIYTVQFAISYALNENFDPEACGQNIEAITEQDFRLVERSTNVLSTSIALVLMILLTFGVLQRKIRR